MDDFASKCSCILGSSHPDIHNVYVLVGAEINKQGGNIREAVGVQSNVAISSPDCAFVSGLCHCSSHLFERTTVAFNSSLAKLSPTSRSAICVLWLRARSYSQWRVRCLNIMVFLGWSCYPKSDFLLWGVDHTFTNYKFQTNNLISTTLDFHPLAIYLCLTHQGQFSAIIVGELIVNPHMDFDCTSGSSLGGF